MPTEQVKVDVILTAVLGSGSWYQISCWSLQVMSGTMNLTSFATSSHSCQVTGSQLSVPAHCLLPELSVSQRVTQFCFVTFRHSGSSFWWGISFLPCTQAFSTNFLAVKADSWYSSGSEPS